MSYTPYNRMSELIPDQIQVKDLPELLGVPRSRIYTLMSSLEIQPTKVGRSAYISQSDYLQLEALQGSIKNGGTISEWLKANRNEPEEVSLVKSNTNVGQISTNNADILLIAIEQILAKALPAKASSTLNLKERLETLTFVAREGLTLSNSQLAELLSLSPKTLSRHSEYRSNGFVFSKVKENKAVFWAVKSSNKVN